jgi:lysophospholipase L1-like esterase
VQQSATLFFLVLALAMFPLAAVAQDNSAIKPVARAEKMKMHENFLEQSKNGNIDLLFLGDSITEGWLSDGKDVWHSAYGSREVANFGVGGDRTQHVLWRLEHGEIDGIKPNVVVLLIGTNNTSDPSNSVDEIAVGVKTIVSKLREKLPDTKILLLGVFPRGEKPNAVRTKLEDVNKQLAHEDDGKMVKYLDIGKIFLQQDGTISPTVMPDFLHLSNEGYQMWADAMEPTLKTMLQPSTK